jgi:Protein of unknown function (DUF2442)
VEVLDRMRGLVFDKARTPEGFAKVTVDPETGTGAWPGGADLAPDTLYERVSTGAWPDHDVAAQHRWAARVAAAGYPFTTQTPVISS